MQRIEPRIDYDGWLLLVFWRTLPALVADDCLLLSSALLPALQYVCRSSRELVCSTSNCSSLASMFLCQSTRQKVCFYFFKFMFTYNTIAANAPIKNQGRRF